MKTTIQRVKIIKFSKLEQKYLKELLPDEDAPKEFVLTDETCNKVISILIDINPDKQEHKDFIMTLIKELKK